MQMDYKDISVYACQRICDITWFQKSTKGQKFSVGSSVCDLSHLANFHNHNILFYEMGI